MFIQGIIRFEGCVFCCLLFPGFTSAKKRGCCKKIDDFLIPRFDRDMWQRACRGTAISGAGDRELSVCLTLTAFNSYIIVNLRYKYANEFSNGAWLRPIGA